MPIKEKAMYGKICDFHKSGLSALKLMGLPFHLVSWNISPQWHYNFYCVEKFMENRSIVMYASHRRMSQECNIPWNLVNALLQSIYRKFFYYQQIKVINIIVTRVLIYYINIFCLIFSHVFLYNLRFFQKLIIKIIKENRLNLISLKLHWKKSY